MKQLSPARIERLKRTGHRAADWVAFLVDRIQDADEHAAAARVQALRHSHPQASTAEIVELLIKKKCQQTAAIGAATAATALVPVLGTLIALTVGAAADIGATLKLQAELALEIAAAHDRVLSAGEKRPLLLVITGVSTGSNQMVSRGGRELSAKLTERYAQRWLERAIPMAGMAAAAGTNVLSTYVIGRRADAYFSRGPEALGDWKDSLRALSGLDERKLRTWLTESATRSRLATGRGARRALTALGDASVKTSMVARSLTTRGRQRLRLRPPKSTDPPP